MPRLSGQQIPSPAAVVETLFQGNGAWVMLYRTEPQPPPALGIPLEGAYKNKTQGLKGD